MTRTLVNLTMSVLVEAIESVLETYPHHPYQKAFAIDELRQDLIAYVLNRIPNFYIVDEPQQAKLSTSLYHSPEERWHLEAVIHQGIESVFCQNVDKVSHHIPEEFDAGFCASNWFG